MKFARLESANVDAFEQANDLESVEQFQNTLDEDAEMMAKISELKILKEELEKIRKDLELQSQGSHVAEKSSVDTSGAATANIWSPSDVHTTIKPPKLDITPFDGNLLKRQEFWDAFEASIGKGRYSSVDKMTYLKSRLNGEALDAIAGY